THSCCTLDVAWKGARLSGFRYSGPTGTVVTVERGKLRSKFRIAWVGEKDSPRDGQIGLESIEPVRGLWGIELPPMAAYIPPPPAIELDPDVAPALSAMPTLPAMPNVATRQDSNTIRYLCRGEAEI